MSARRNKAYTIGEAVEEINRRTGLGISAETLRRYCHQGAITAFRPGGGLTWWRIPVSVVEKYIEANTPQSLDKDRPTA